MTENQSQDVCEEAVFERLFYAHARVLRNFLYYRCGSLSLAEDWLQEAFLRMWEECKHVHYDKARAYLFTVANRLFIDHTRHEKVVLKFAQKQVQTGIFIETPDFILETAELQTALENAIAGLPETQRVVFLMNRLDGLTYAEIAELLNLSVKAVEKRMHGALLALRPVIKKI